jgi:hypothetical protein
MNEAMEDLARQAVASPHWRWLPGMLVVSTNNHHRPARIESLDGDTYGLTVIPHANGPVFASHHEYGIVGEFPHGSSVPDFGDPATLGCLLALVRDALGHDVWIEPVARQGEPVRWCVYGLAVVWDSGDHDTQAAALVVALESARAAGRS